ncbi:MAG: hypothetical protein AAF297_09065 [Planctomycetota bacterium]
MTKLCGIGAVAVALAAGSAMGNVHAWTWERGDTNSNNGGGVIERIETSFQTSARELTFSVWFSNQVTDGFTLALNDGPNPKGHAGELALIYLDASDTNDVRVNSFAYNGQNTQKSFEDGSAASGIQTPDAIATSTGALARNGFAVGSVTDTEDGWRRIDLTLDVRGINSHSPLHPGPGGAEEWYGIGFDELLGIWFHPVKDLTTAYDQDGFLSEWNGREGYVDTANRVTIPGPGAAMLAGVGGLMIGARRRR